MKLRFTKFCCVRRVDLPLLDFQSIAGRNEYSCDVDVEPIIEFGRCYVTPDFIRGGRLFRIDKYWSYDGNLIIKPQEFTEWGERLYKAAKKFLTKVEQDCYAGQHALEMRKAGIAFEGLDIPIDLPGG